MYISLVYLRAIAPLLVFYDHIIGIKYSQYDKLEIHEFVTDFFIKPFGIIQDFGFLGVALFFILSGFIISSVITKETLLDFSIKRLLRIYPALIISIFLIYILSMIFTNYMEKFELNDILLSMTLFNYVLIDNNPVQGVAWTLFIEILFYILFGICYYISKDLKKTFIYLAILVALIIQYSREFGDNFFLLAASVSYLPFLMSGILIFVYNSEKRINIIFLLVNIFLILFSLFTIHTDFLLIDNSYLINYFYAILIFLFFIINENKFKENKIVKFYNDISYSFYLYHGFLGFLIIDLLFKYVGVLSIIISFILATFISYISFKFIEKPINSFWKKKSTRSLL